MAEKIGNAQGNAQGIDFLKLFGPKTGTTPRPNFFDLSDGAFETGLSKLPKGGFGSLFKPSDSTGFETTDWTGNILGNPIKASDYGGIFNQSDIGGETFKPLPEGGFGSLLKRSDSTDVEDAGLVNDILAKPVNARELFGDGPPKKELSWYQKADGTMDLEGIGKTISGIGVIGGALAQMYGIQQQKKYQDKIIGMEEKRIARAETRQDKAQAEYDAVWKNS